MNEKPEITNAKIESTMLGIEDHGIMTCFLILDYGGSGQGFGGWALDQPKHKDEEFVGRFGTAYGMEFIKRILNTLEVDKWEDLVGKHCRAEHDNGKIYAIGHVLKNKWFRPETDLKKFSKALAEERE